MGRGQTDRHTLEHTYLGADSLKITVGNQLRIEELPQMNVIFRLKELIMQ